LSIIWRALFPPLAQEKNSYYVLEYSSDQPGDMRFLTDHLPPDVAVITQIAPVHLQHFANLDELIQEELAVTKGLKKEGTLLFNADDPWQKDCSQEVSQKVGFSITKAQLNYQPDQVGLIVNNTSYTTKLLGVHQEQAVLIAITLGELEGIAPEKIQKAILQYEVPPGRGRVLHGRSDWVIIDDSHNASPEAVKAALVMLKTVASARRRVAVLGQMNELGPDADRLHEAVGQAVPTNADVLIAIGSCAEATKRGALAAGMLAAAIYTFATPTEAAKLMESIFQPGDAILFKASQNGMRFERLIKPLLLHPADSSKLTRQSSYWLTHA
jgi:UDP-N-acetylmuramoyl-tripeptide--D-alanyl-D-alanine ligase